MTLSNHEWPFHGSSIPSHLRRAISTVAELLVIYLWNEWILPITDETNDIEKVTGLKVKVSH